MLVKQNLHDYCKRSFPLLLVNDCIYLLPHSALSGWISNYTVSFPSRDTISDSYTVIPHGSATLVFACDRNGLHCNLFGPITKPCTVGSHANQCDMLFIIEFQPSGLHCLTGITQKELTDLKMPFAIVDAELNSLMLNVLETAKSIEELTGEIDRLLLSRLHCDLPAEMRLATEMIIENGGNVSHRELSNSVYYSERHINRIFDQYVGMNTKTFSRMVRINKAIHLLQNPRRSVTAVCNLTGFYDLSHFIRDFRAVSGMTPQEYRSNMSDFYSEIAKF